MCCARCMSFNKFARNALNMRMRKSWAVHWEEFLEAVWLKYTYEGEFFVLLSSGVNLYWVLFIANSFVNRVRGLAFALAV